VELMAGFEPATSSLPRTETLQRKALFTEQPGRDRDLYIHQNFCLFFRSRNIPFNERRDADASIQEIPEFSVG